MCDHDAPRAKLRYEEYINAYGEEARRPIGIGWTADPAWSMRLSDWTWVMDEKEKEKEAPRMEWKTGDDSETPDKALISQDGTLADNYPRLGAIAPANDDQSEALAAAKKAKVFDPKRFWRKIKLPSVVITVATPPPPTAGPRRRRQNVPLFDDDEAA